MKIVFAGTAHFAIPSLKSLIHLCGQLSHYTLVGIYTQPDRPCGRGQSLQVSPVKEIANMHSLPIYQPKSLKTESSQQKLYDLKPDLIVVAAYGLLLPPAVLAVPSFGCINVHGSLLPRWRGAAPIQRAISAGDTVTGITMMQMDSGLDTGPILYQQQIPILAADTAATLQTRLAALGADCLLRTLKHLSDYQARALTQNEDEACYADKLSKEEGLINWHESAECIERKIRAFNPWPVCFTRLQGQRLRVWEAEVKIMDSDGSLPGSIVAIDKFGIRVATGKGYLQLTKLQREGGRCLPVMELLNGPLATLSVGMRFNSLI
jgi:methionyl-tRNA formyltransferase